MKTVSIAVIAIAAFLRLPTLAVLTPTQQAYIKASNTGRPTPGETFGSNQNFALISA